MITTQQVKTLFKLFWGTLLAVLGIWCASLYHTNKKLSEGLEMAKNNAEMYQNVIAGAREQNNILKLTVEDLRNTNDSLLQLVNSRVDQLGIKPSNIKTIATQNQTLHVNGGKGVEGILIPNISKTDSILFNDLTIVFYTLNKDSINIILDIANTQDLYVYKHKEWKNKKTFLKRLFTLDFKKVQKESYIISNSNDLINTSDVRVVEIIN